MCESVDSFVMLIRIHFFFSEGQLGNGNIWIILNIKHLPSLLFAYIFRVYLIVLWLDKGENSEVIKCQALHT